jgi:tetratricopeptide (TPR) repeat protein
MTAISAPTETTAVTPEQQIEQDVALVMQAALEYHQKQEFDAAAALYAVILDAVNDHAEANNGLGVLRLQTGLPADAVAHFEVALGRAPNNGQYWVNYIEALVESGQIDAARIALDLARQRGVRGLAIETLVSRLDNSNAAIAAVDSMRLRH